MFSVAIPIYNHARYLRKAVYSCLASSLVREILIVDDGSTDASAAIARDLSAAHPDRILNLTESTPVNRGAHVRLNQLCTAASQPWIAILNSDDFFPAHRFDLIRLITRTSRCDFVAGSMLIIDENDHVIGTKRGILQPEYACPLATGLDGPLQTDDLRLLSCSQNFIATTSNIAFRKSLFEKIGGFADLRYSHDWDFALRATMFGKCIWTPNFLTCYRVHNTNTIKEQSPHMDGEIVRLFYRFLADFSLLENDPAIRAALASNQHIYPYSPEVASIQPHETDEEITHSYRFPPNLHRRTLLNSLLALYFFSYDFILISSNLDELPVLHGASREDMIICRSTISTFFSAEESSSIGLRGRYMRMPPPESASQCQHNVRDIPGFRSASVCGANILLGDTASNDCTRQESALRALIEEIDIDHSKPVCLVLPIFMAVGGAERNTIELMRQLQTAYQFVVVTTERLAKSQGSLHHQLDELRIPTFDLGEIGDTSSHLSLLAVLKGIFEPDLVWICNGSPWLSENAQRLRRLFAKSAIVDQQVYDTEVGWIQHYNRSGIQSFDRFIAINQRIHQKFVSELRIPAHRVDQIYHLINSPRIIAARPPRNRSLQAAREAIGIPSKADRLFVFVGRLTTQKRPLSFLELASGAARHGWHDHFLMIGDGELAKNCEDFIFANNLKNTTCIPYHRHPADIFALADGMVITSDYEGLPIAMLEALAIGIPVFGTDVGDIKLVLDEYGVGEAVPRDSTAEDRWQAFVAWRSRLCLMQQSALERRDEVAERFGAQKIAALYHASFQAALLGRHR